MKQRRIYIITSDNPMFNPTPYKVRSTLRTGLEDYSIEVQEAIEGEESESEEDDEE